MFGHLPELGIIMVLGLIVFGPEKLPEVAANVGKMMREVRQAMNVAINPQEDTPEEFSTFYYESMARSGDMMPEVTDLDDEELALWPNRDEIEPVVAEEVTAPSGAVEASARPVEPQEVAEG